MIKWHNYNCTPNVLFDTNNASYYRSFYCANHSYRNSHQRNIDQSFYLKIPQNKLFLPYRNSYKKRNKSPVALYTVWNCCMKRYFIRSQKCHRHIFMTLASDWGEGADI